MGDVHLDVVLEKLKRKYGVEATLSTPRVPYQETITATARAEKKYKKQSGGAGLYGHCVIEVATVGRGEGFLRDDQIFCRLLRLTLRTLVYIRLRINRWTGA